MLTSHTDTDRQTSRGKAMYSGICICVLLAVLSASSTGQQTVGSMNEDPGAREIEQQNILQHPRHIRASSSAQLKPYQRIDGNSDQKAVIGAMLAKYLQTRKGSSTGRYAVLPNRPVIDPTHRINDRDYMGWMDFGRRSAEEYEYSS
ncbi:cholecystokinin isoform X2 [Rana temporaria]|uniref:cholecystokinin isoform X2 n=1 Tax=Rana temporaria TaxID=8407 RepID=UPI001AAD3233|nr:cholecystokinin isoform X2 [Rana temporaria]